MSSEKKSELKNEERKITVDLPFTIADGKISKKQYDAENKKMTTIPLCNFCALVSKQTMIVYPDRSELWYEVDGFLDDGTCLQKQTIASSEFEALGWVTRWGIGAIIYPTRNYREEIRAAIQQLSRNAPTVIIYGHVGWNTIESDTPIYITSSGALTQNGVQASI